MPRGKTKKALTGRQQEIVDLANSGAAAAEIAKILKASPGSVYQQLSRLRSAGHLPKVRAGNGRRGQKLAPATVTRQEGNRVSEGPSFDEMMTPARDNGGLSVEEHLGKELDAVLHRIEEVRLETERLAAEGTELQGRRERYEKAAKALSSSV